MFYSTIFRIMALLKESRVKELQVIIQERFGEPIDRATATVGITDDRSGKVATRGEGSYEDGEDLSEDDIEEVARSMHNKKKS